MTSTASWGYVDTGLCPSCDTPNFLYTHSLKPEVLSKVERYSNPDYIIQCFDCSLSGLSYLVRATQTMRDFELICESPYVNDVRQLTYNPPARPEGVATCEPCGAPLLESTEGLDNYNASRWQTVEATHGENRTIIVQVHKRCSAHLNCCNTTYVSGWASEANVRIYELEGSQTCRTCLYDTLETRGHSINEYFTCGCCDSLYHRDNRERFRNSDYCSNCYDDNVFTCSECDEEYWENAGHSCYNEDDDEEGSYLIHDYHYKPRPYFFGKTATERLYFGIELEVENTSGSLHDNASIVQEELGERVYLKHDGSLNEGFEIVTHPHSLTAFQKEFKWESFTKFRREGLRSWDTSTCGLHVHVSRDAFGIPYDNRTDRATYIKSRQTHEIKFIKLIYDNERQICRIAGRKNDEYANFYDRGNIVSKVKWDNARGGRHSAVNTQNDTTLEVRVFKGSLQPMRVLAAVELVHAAVEYTRDLKVTGPKAMVVMPNGKAKSNALSWLAFTGYVSANADLYPNLTAQIIRSFDSERIDD